MDTAIRVVDEAGPLGPLLLGAAAICALSCLGAVALGLRRLHAPGSPRRALLASVALAAPLLLPVLGSFLAVPSPGGEPLAAATAALHARVLAGTAGLLLALPVGLASCLWAGIAAGRRVLQAGERARLSAAAAGQGELGRRVAAALDRTPLPPLGAAIGLLAAFLVVGAPSLALYVSGTDGLENLSLTTALGGAGGPMLGALQARAGAGVLRLGAAIGAGGSITVALLLGVLLHAGSSRRRNLAVALQAVDGPGPVRTSVENALAATGRPGPLGPIGLALLLLALAVLVWRQAAELRARAEAPADDEAVACGKTATGYPQGRPPAFLVGDRSAGRVAVDATALLP